MSGGFSLRDTSWAISASVRVWKFLVLLITIGITLLEFVHCCVVVWLV